MQVARRSAATFFQGSPKPIRVKRVLIVDDNTDLRRMMKAALELEGYAVDEAANGREALTRQRSRPATIVITDIFMPEADGFETIASLRKEFPAIKILVMSGDGKLSRREYLSTAKLLDVEGTLKKPFDMESLLKTLRALG